MGERAPARECAFELAPHLLRCGAEAEWAIRSAMVSGTAAGRWSESVPHLAEFALGGVEIDAELFRGDDVCLRGDGQFGAEIEFLDRLFPWAGGG